MTVDPIEELKRFSANWDGTDSPAIRALNAAIEHLQKKENEGYLGFIYRTEYEVEGEDEFPYDMLRYVSSFPADEHSATLMHSRHEEKRKVRLMRYHRDPEPQLAADRWMNKFHWKVVGVIDTVKL